MLKYLKHYIPAITGIFTIIFFLMGENYPTYFCIGWSLFLIIGDYILPRDKEIQDFAYPTILNFSIYINLPILFCLILKRFPGAECTLMNFQRLTRLSWFRYLFFSVLREEDYLTCVLLCFR